MSRNKRTFRCGPVRLTDNCENDPRRDYVLVHGTYIHILHTNTYNACQYWLMWVNMLRYIDVWHLRLTYLNIYVIREHHPVSWMGLQVQTSSCLGKYILLVNNSLGFCIILSMSSRVFSSAHETASITLRHLSVRTNWHPSIGHDNWVGAVKHVQVLAHPLINDRIAGVTLVAAIKTRIRAWYQCLITKMWHRNTTLLWTGASPGYFLHCLDIPLLHPMSNHTHQRLSSGRSCSYRKAMLSRETVPYRTHRAKPVH